MYAIPNRNEINLDGEKEEWTIEQVEKVIEAFRKEQPLMKELTIDVSTYGKNKDGEQVHPSYPAVSVKIVNILRSLGHNAAYKTETLPSFERRRLRESIIIPNPYFADHAGGMNAQPLENGTIENLLADYNFADLRTKAIIKYEEEYIKFLDEVGNAFSNPKSYRDGNDFIKIRFATQWEGAVGLRVKKFLMEERQFPESDIEFFLYSGNSSPFGYLRIRLGSSITVVSRLVTSIVSTPTINTRPTPVTTVPIVENKSEPSSSECCVICLTNSKNSLIMPCKHLCLCEECSSSVQASNCCPICRTKITGIIKVFT